MIVQIIVPWRLNLQIVMMLQATPTDATEWQHNMYQILLYYYNQVFMACDAWQPKFTG